MDENEIRRRLLARFSIRTGNETGRYVLRHLIAGRAIPVMGGDARTGVAVRVMIDPRELSATADVSHRPPQA